MVSCRVFLRGRDAERTHKQICKLIYYMLVCRFETNIQTAEFYLFCMTTHALEYFSRTVLTPVVGDMSVEEKTKKTLLGTPALAAALLTPLCSLPVLQTVERRRALPCPVLLWMLRLIPDQPPAAAPAPPCHPCLP